MERGSTRHTLVLPALVMLPRRRVPHRRFPDKFSGRSQRGAPSRPIGLPPADEQRISAMDSETEARWQRAIIEENPRLRDLWVFALRAARAIGSKRILPLARNSQTATASCMAEPSWPLPTFGRGRERAQSAGRRKNDHDREQDQLLPGGPARRDGPCGLHPAPPGRTTMVWQTTITRADGKDAAIVTQTQLVITSWRRPSAASHEP